MTASSRVLFIFLDGVGIGPADSEVNPFMRARLPTLTRLMGGRIPTLDAPHTAGADGRAFPLDATLGVEGLPQSGTGQVALLTGESAAELMGRHFGPWTPVRLRPVVQERNVLRRAVEAGRVVAFANAYPREWPGLKGGRRIAGPPLAAQAAGILDRHEEALGRGAAVSSEILNNGWKTHLGHHWLPEVSPARAGANLARIAGQADLTMFAHYATDAAGHSLTRSTAVDALELVDAFLEGVVESMTTDTLLLIASDHGNLEDVRAGHTRGPALGVAAGPGSEPAARLSDLRQVTPFLLDILGVETA